MDLAAFGLVEANISFVKQGDRYGRLFVVTVGKYEGTYDYQAICWCDCNSGLKRIRAQSLKSGAVVSCGCYHKEVTSSHNLSKHRYYSRWQNMMDRCYNPECAAYPDYGGRGIKVCKDWHDVSKYVEQLPDGYFEGAHLDRINNDGDYEPTNVRWVTPKQNHGNRRSARLISFNGATLSATEWSTVTGLPASAITNRLDEQGWSVEETLTTPLYSDSHKRMKRAHEFRWAGHVKKPAPPKREFRTVEYQGETILLSELVRRTGIPHKTLAKRIFERGWSVDRAVAKG